MYIVNVFKIIFPAILSTCFLVPLTSHLTRSDVTNLVFSPPQLLVFVDSASVEGKNLLDSVKFIQELLAAIFLCINLSLSTEQSAAMSHQQSLWEMYGHKMSNHNRTI